MGTLGNVGIVALNRLAMLPEQYDDKEKIADDNYVLAPNDYFRNMFICSSNGCQSLSTDGIKFQPGTTRHVDSCMSCVLLEDQDIQGIRYKSGDWVLFSKSGELASVTLTHDQIIQGIQFKNGEQIRFHKNGIIFATILSTNREIQGIRCSSKHPIEFFENGRLHTAILAEAQEIQGQRLGAETAIHFDEKGQLSYVRLLRDGLFQDQKFNTETTIYFDEKGKVGWMSIQGLIFQAETKFSFDENGKLYTAKLAKDQKIKGRKFKTGTIIYFDKSGDIDEAVLTLTKDQKIQGIKCKSGENIWFYGNGKLKKTTLSEKQTLQGNHCVKGTSIFLDEDGKLSHVILPKDMMFGAKISFDENGYVYEIVFELQKDTEIDGVKCKGGENVWLYGNLHIKRAVLSEDLWIEDVKLEAGTDVYFDEDGNVYEVFPPNQQKAKILI